MRLLAVVGILIVAGFAGFWTLTVPATWALLHSNRDVADAGAANLGNGRGLFYAGGCGTCHATPDAKAASPICCGWAAAAR